MLFGFDTESLIHGKAALLLYAMYKSRESNSSLNGLETWERCLRYIRGATLKASNTAEFVEAFCHKAGTLAIKPKYLTENGIVQMEDGTLVRAEGVYDFKPDIFADNEILGLFREEKQYIVMLVRERLQRERLEFTHDDN